MKILNWNTQIASPRGVNGRFEIIQDLLAAYDADLTCLTEAYPETFPSGGYIISSGLSGWGRHERLGARKVLLRSKSPWYDVDNFGSPHLPEGRFVSAVTELDSVPVTVVGMCIPYHGYRANKAAWGDDSLKAWEGACRYLDALRQDILPHLKGRERIVLLGDFNLQIPPKNYPYRDSAVNGKRMATFADFRIATSHADGDAALDKPFIDHVALSYDIIVESMEFFSRMQADGTRLSDHNGVCIDVSLDFEYACVVQDM